MEIRYAPVSYWNLTGKEVAFGFTYETKEEAEAHGKKCEKLYGDQKFSHVKEVCYDA